MGMYERIISNRKKDEEETNSIYERITGEKNSSSNSALLNYNKQKSITINLNNLISLTSNILLQE